MRLWHYELIPVLPNKMLVAQLRECIAIKRQWKKGTLKHPLVSYVMNYNKEYFLQYVSLVRLAMDERKIKYKKIYYGEIFDFCADDINFDDESGELNYPEHNNRYFQQCYFNLQEKYDRGIISEEEWIPISKLWWNKDDEKYN